MGRRSQEALLRRGERDSAGNLGYEITITSPVPFTGTAPGGGALAVKVRDVNGNPVQGLVVSAVTTDAGVATIAATDTSDAAGQLSFTTVHVVAGTCEFQLSYAGAPNLIRIPVVIS